MVVTGIIRPPPEIRAVADRTALYVAKNGRAFEQRILGSEKGKTPKFSFLHQTSPFRAYYEDRITFYENGGEDKKEDPVSSKKEEKKLSDTAKLIEENKQLKRSIKASVIDPVAKALLDQKTKITQSQTKPDDLESKNENDGNGTMKVASIPPQPFHFINIAPPSSLSISQLESIQLVAQFVALDGKGGSFLNQLTYREWNNPMFSFCQPRHAHFPYFSALVDAYSRILNVWTSDNNSEDDNVKRMFGNLHHCLSISAYRAEYELDAEKKRRKSDDDGDTELSAKIDWHEFAVVETINFPVDEAVELSMLPPPPLQPEPNIASFTNNQSVHHLTDASDDEEQIRVVPSYKPKIVALQDAKIDTVIDPISGKSIPVKDMPEHMRIQLLDPKWAEERRKFQEKQKESNLVSGDLVASNLQRFAQARGDYFGKTNLTSSDNEIKRKSETNTVQEYSKVELGPSLPGQERILTDNMQGNEYKRPRLDLPPPNLNFTLPPQHPPPAYPTLPVQQPSSWSNVDIPLTSPIPPDTTRVLTASQFGLPAPAFSGTGEIIPESEFAASLSKPDISIQIRIPNDPTQMAWNFYGQIVSITVDVLSDVKNVKTILSNQHLNNIPANKIQLKNTESGAFLKDALSLAAHNIRPGTTLELVPRARGGKKK